MALIGWRSLIAIIIVSMSGFGPVDSAAGEGKVQTPKVDIVLAPSAIDPDKGTAILTVRMTISGAETNGKEISFVHQGGAPGMRAPIMISDLQLKDADGNAPIVEATYENDARGWKSQRSVRGPISVSYYIRIDNRNGGILATIPHVEGEGLSGIGNMILLLPRLHEPYGISIRWDLTAMPAGSRGVTSFGDGNISLPAGSLKRLEFMMVMAGKIARQPKDPNSPFAAVWTAEPTFDARSAMQWSNDLYHWMSVFFKDPAEPVYRVFLRNSDRKGANGVAAPHSFMASYDDSTTAEGIKSLLGHEMTHTWTAADIGKWYSEGNAVYYQVRLPWRAGMVSTDDYLKDINATAGRYYSNTAINAPDTEILPNFWSDKRMSVLPYDRGAMYFALLDGKIRRASEGRRGIDDLILAMVDLNRRGRPVTEKSWTDILRSELGEEGVKIHRDMMAGATIVPESGDFGPCFERVSTTIRQFDLGFGGPEVGQYSVVKNLRPYSEAAKAGLREGDKVSYGFSTSGPQGDPEMKIDVRVTRGDESFVITYLPRGAAVPAYQWVRSSGASKDACPG